MLRKDNDDQEVNYAKLESLADNLIPDYSNPDDTAVYNFAQGWITRSFTG